LWKLCRCSGWSVAATRGHFTEARKHHLLAAEQDPVSILQPFEEFFTHNFGQDAMGEEKALQKVLRIRPTFIGAHALFVVITVEQRDCHAARAEADWIVESWWKSGLKAQAENC
jgi:hypothetical protein